MNIFLDLGFYAGNALKKYIEDGTVDDTWKIYAFEPNPDIPVKETIKQFPMKITLMQKAVWIKEGYTAFHIAGREDAAGIADLTGHTDPKEVIVPTINFSKFVADLPNANIICSMDIEGAEFVVLEKMIEDGTIDKINVLDIEFHHRFMNDYTEVESQELIDKLTRRGVKVKLKVELV